MKKSIRQINHNINAALDNFYTVLMIILCIVVLLQVVFRFALKIPSPWSEETARYLLILITFLGASASIRRKSHLIAMNVFEKASKWISFINKLLIELSILFVSIILLYGSNRMVEVTGTEMATSMTWLKMGYLYQVISFSFILTIIYTLINIYKLFREFYMNSKKAKRIR